MSGIATNDFSAGIRDAQLSSPSAPGVFIATADGGAATNPNAGQITSAGPPRQMQLGVKLTF